MGLVFPGCTRTALVTPGFGKLPGNRVSVLAFIRSYGPEAIMLAGICLLAWLPALVSFVFPIAWPVPVSVSAVAAACISFNFRFFAALPRDYGRSLVFFFLAGVLVFLLGLLTPVHAAQPPSFYDSGIYPIRFIKWIQNYAVVPGLGNLHGRFAFNAHVHLLSFFLSPAPGLVFIGYRPLISSPMPASSVALEPRDGSLQPGFRINPGYRGGIGFVGKIKTRKAEKQTGQ